MFNSLTQSSIDRYLDVSSIFFTVHVLLLVYLVSLFKGGKVHWDRSKTQWKFLNIADTTKNRHLIVEILSFPNNILTSSGVEALPSFLNQILISQYFP